MPTLFIFSNIRYIEKQNVSGEKNWRPDLVYLFRNQCGEDLRVQQQVVGYPEE